jgi:signal transduction histidine kinase
LKEVRSFSRDLRPAILDDLGLLPALEWVADQLLSEHGIETKLNVKGTPRKLLRETELTIFRIVQEATRNIAKHSRAKQAEIQIEFFEDKIKAVVKDNGVGFKPPDTLGALPRTGKLGLAGMQERVKLLNGSISLTSEPGKGTAIFLEFPV